jgi:hypothetical protein
MAGISYQWSWSAVIATIQNIDEVASLTSTSSFRSDVRTAHVTPEVSSAQVIRGHWWLPTTNADGYIALENTSLTPKQATLQITGHSGNSLVTQQISLPSHATTRVKLSAALGNAWGTETIGGIEIDYAGPDHGVLAYAGIEDGTVGYSASPQLTEDHLDPSRPVHQVTLSAPGLKLGSPNPVMLFPAESYFKPYAYLHNVSANPLQVTLTLVIPGTGSIPQTQPLGQVTLQPGQVSKFDFESQFSSANPLPNGSGHLTASFQGRDGDLQISAGSVDQTQSYVFEVNPSQQADSASRTLCFWSIEGDNDSTITVWNYKPTAQDLVLTLYYFGGHYAIPIHLGPLETYNLDMRSLVNSRAPDPSGALIPSNVTGESGSAVLSSPAGELEPISVAVSASVFNVRNATCGLICNTCNGVTEAQFDPISYLTSAQSTIQAIAQLTMNTGTITTNPSNAQWHTGNTAVATVNSSGLVTGVAAGATNVQVDFLSVPVDAGTICAAEYVPCPTETVGVTPGSLGIIPIILGVSPMMYGGSGTVTITGSGFLTLGGPGTAVTVNIGNSGISGGLSSGTITSDSTITAPYSVGCSVSTASLYTGDNVLSISGNFVNGGVIATQSFPLEIQFPISPPPTISMLNGLTSNVVVGQQISLQGNQSLPNCMTVQTQWWNPPTGTAVGGYKNLAGTGIPDTTGGKVQPLPAANTANYTFYWVSPGNGLSVQYNTLLVTTSGDLVTVSSQSATASFNVSGPQNLTVFTCSYVTSSAGSVGCTANGVMGTLRIQGVNILKLGGGNSGTNLGDAFTASASASPPGTFSFVQLLNHFDITFNQSNGPCYYNIDADAVGLLDTSYPYGNDNTPTTPNGPTYTDDNPAVPLLPDDLNVTTLFSATMYVMWTPSGTSGPVLPVPLGSVTWGWEGEAVQVGGIGTGTWSVYTPYTVYNQETFVPGTTYPQWDQTAVGSVPPCN